MSRLRASVSAYACACGLLLLVQGCVSVPPSAPGDSAASLTLLAYRVRADFTAALNADTGWAAAPDTAATLHYDEPFRLRVQVQGSSTPAQGHLLGLQYRWQDGPWQTVGVAQFPYPSLASPLVSVTSTPAYAHGDETERLLGDPAVDWDEGAGLNGSALTPVWRGDDAVEWEWPLVVRRFSDGPTFAEDGSIIALRVVDGQGQALASPSAITLQLSARPGHLGGTFIETPGRLGPYQTDAGNLYFFMEPTETDNRFMAVMSSDHGQSWREVDGSARPTADDLEGVASTRIGATVHLLHQVSREVFYHAFVLDEGTGSPAHWLVNSESIATPEEPPTQYAGLAARSDGSLVAVYGGSRRLFLQLRSAQGSWGEPVEIDANLEPELSGPVLASGPDDLVTLAYTGRDGSGYIRHLRPDGALSERLQLSTRLGTSDAENGAILPLVVVPDSGTTVVLYRESDGLLYERRFTRDATLSPPLRVTSVPVVTDAVDSEQVGADLVLHEGTLHLLFIDEATRSIHHMRSDTPGRWSAPRTLVTDIDGAWVRGSIHRDAAGNTVYGFIYDAGSKGGSGFNRYLVLPL